MKKKLLVSCLIIAMVSGTSAAVQTTYSYTGANYSFGYDSGGPAGSYTTDMRLQGSITLVRGIAPNNVGSVQQSDIVAFSFFDGRIRYTKDDTPSGGNWRLGTDASGNIDNWWFFLRRLYPSPDLFFATVESRGPTCYYEHCDSA